MTRPVWLPFLRSGKKITLPWVVHWGPLNENIPFVFVQVGAFKWSTFVQQNLLSLLRVLTMTVLGEPEKPNGLLGIALAKESGIIDIQYVKKKWALPQPEESEKLNLLLLQAS